MKKIISILFLLISISFFAQQSSPPHNIKGTIIDAETKLPLSFATITFHSEKENNFSGGVTNDHGQFDINISTGTYRISFDFFSFQSKVIDSLLINKDIDLGEIYLSSDVENLDEVEVNVSGKLIEHKFNKKIYYASKDIANVGGNAITVMENTPSVRVDPEGKFSIRGSTVLVLVNGRPFGGQKNNAEVLSLIPSNSIDRVEIVTQSAKYNAQGGGILNIILKKGKLQGYNGTVEVHGGVPDNGGASTFINYKSDKINVFSTASFNHLDKIKNSEINQTYFDEESNPTGFLEQSSIDNRQRNSALFSIGSDFYLDTKNTITTSILYTLTNKNFDSDLNFNDFNAFFDPVQITKRDVWDNTDEHRLEALVNYTKTFKTEDQKLSFDVQYDRYHSDNITDIKSLATLQSSDLLQQQSVKYQELDNYLARADYQFPINDTGLLETGLSTNFRKYYNDFSAKILDDSEKLYIPLEGYNNEINYDENVYAAYVNFSKELEKFNFSVALRAETTKTDIKEESSDTEETNDYTDFFPSASVGYSFKDDSMLSFFYSRYIDRPQVHQLNPFVSFANDRLISTGNPYLKPFYSNRFILEFNKDLGKFNITSALFYTDEKDQISSVLSNSGEQTIDGFDIFIKKPMNNGDLDQYGFDLELTYLPSKFLRFRTYLSPYYFDLSNTLDNTYDYSDFMFYGNFMAELKFPKSLKLQLRYTYQSPKKTALTNIDRIQYINASLSKQLWDNKATLTFKANDLFGLRKYSYSSNEANTFT
ncbi:MAG: outer membrane beta-barrel family protein, partial [Bacteroidota bacterium]